MYGAAPAAGRKTPRYGARAKSGSSARKWKPARDDRPDVATAGIRLRGEGGKGPETGPFYIQGRKASDLEWRTYRMLKRLKWREQQIQFQVDVLGGKLPGGKSLDFVVWTYAMPTVIEPNGDYWHTSTEQVKQRDKERYQMIVTAWRRPFIYISIAQGDMLTDDMAYQLLLRKVGRG